jgi:hypothetical protein
MMEATVATIASEMLVNIYPTTSSHRHFHTLSNLSFMSSHLTPDEPV